MKLIFLILFIVYSCDALKLIRQGDNYILQKEKEHQQYNYDIIHHPTKTMCMIDVQQDYINYVSAKRKQIFDYRIYEYDTEYCDNYEIVFVDILYYVKCMVLFSCILLCCNSIIQYIYYKYWI